MLGKVSRALGNGNGERVAIVVVDEEGVARDALAHEADLLVERDGMRVVRSNLEFDPDQPSPGASATAASRSRKPSPRPRIATTAMPTVPRWVKAGKGPSLSSSAP